MEKHTLLIFRTGKKGPLYGAHLTALQLREQSFILLTVQGGKFLEEALP